MLVSSSFFDDFLFVGIKKNNIEMWKNLDPNQNKTLDPDLNLKVSSPQGKCVQVPYLYPLYVYPLHWHVDRMTDLEIAVRTNFQIVSSFLLENLLH